MSRIVKKNFGIVYMRVCHAEDLIHKVTSTDPENYKLKEIDGLLKEARRHIKVLLSRRVRRCKNCGVQLCEGVCMNYGYSNDPM